jgi:hypothetical protein
MKSSADAIRAIGVESCILSTDLGQAGNPLPADGFGALLMALRGLGFSAPQLDRMAKQNPASLLGLGDKGRTSGHHNCADQMSRISRSAPGPDS